ncbi:hypothetical protein B0H17DRAFT_1138358 [Mycena rosella]|uniref:Uncharacterized protein n=1 Tax=Mycena rosella TaxID=1033263 RepID=A0AAD7DA61_MYCRO|nr:hypothetical protein B0H17DRAFT_1138358 [Mycena rosella]
MAKLVGSVILLASRALQGDYTSPGFTARLSLGNLKPKPKPTEASLLVWPGLTKPRLGWRGFWLQVKASESLLGKPTIPAPVLGGNGLCKKNPRDSRAPRLDLELLRCCGGFPRILAGQPFMGLWRSSSYFLFNLHWRGHDTASARHPPTLKKVRNTVLRDLRNEFGKCRVTPRQCALKRLLGLEACK